MGTTTAIKENLNLANAVFAFHFLLVLFIIIAPFTNIPSISFLHITFSMCLLIHWYTNSNVCSLSLLESKLRGLHYTTTFMHKFISPIYDNTYYILTILLMCISSFGLYKNKEKIKNTFKNVFNSHSMKEFNINSIPLLTGY